MITSNKNSNEEKKGATRRDFLGWLAIGSFWAVIASTFSGMIRFVRPAVSPDVPSRLKLGSPEDFPPGTVRKFEDKNVYVLRDQGGIYAISAVCTHLG